MTDASAEKDDRASCANDLLNEIDRWGERTNCPKDVLRADFENTVANTVAGNYSVPSAEGVTDGDTTEGSVPSSDRTAGETPIDNDGSIRRADEAPDSESLPN